MEHPAPLPFWLPNRLTRSAVSQFMHGERQTAVLCRHLLPSIDEADARVCLEMQIADELRHADLYRRYLAPLGPPAPPQPALARIFNSLQRWRGGPEGPILILHLILEGEALWLQKRVEMWLPCPLFRSMSRRSP
ncbi:MAG: hypothetical protein HC826_02170 [Rhodospirillales bacterium]|nr:hypothetical protein [Rhodospirillales bacterium]